MRKRKRERVPHIVRFHVVPGPELRYNASVQIGGDHGIRVKARRITVPGYERTKVALGVEIDVHLRAKDLEEAERVGGEAADNLMNEISVFAAARCGEVLPRIVVQTDPASETHPFRQYVPVGPEFSRRRVDPRKMKEMRDALGQLDPDLRKSVLRGMQAYRQAMSVFDPYLEFSFLWVAVEAMNKPLGVRRGLMSPGPLEGTRAFFKSRNIDKLYKDAHYLRNKILHGSRNVAALTNRASELVGPMRLAAREAVASCIDMHWTGDERPLKNYPILLKLELQLKAPKGARLGQKKDLPHFEVGEQEILALARKSGQIKFETRIPVEAERFGPEVSLGDTVRVQLLGEQVGPGKITLG